MRLVLSRRTPEVTRILLVESGPRPVAERAVERFRAVFGANVAVDALCCLPAAPQGVEKVWRVTDSRTPRERIRLLQALRAERYPVIAILAADDPTLAPWKWTCLAALPSKALIVNENADFFWLDRGHWRPLTQLWRHRTGFGGESAVRALGGVVAFPFLFVYLLFYAGWVHAVRGMRLAFGRGRVR